MFEKALEKLKNILSTKIWDEESDDYNTFKVFLEHEFARMPAKAHATDAGWDICSCEHITIKPKQWAAVNTGIKFVIPDGWEIQIRARSGLALKKGISVLNGPGTIDTDYRGLIKVILYNAGEYPLDICPGDKIAQAVMCPIFRVEMKEIDSMPVIATTRNEGGFGSSGS